MMTARRLAAALVRVDLAKDEGTADVRKLLAGEELAAEAEDQEAANQGADRTKGTFCTVPV